MLGRIASGQRQMKAAEESKQRGYDVADRQAGFTQQSNLAQAGHTQQLAV